MMLREVLTATCCMCGCDGVVTVPAAGYASWRAGVHIQDALPALSPGEREQLLTGIHPACWAVMVGEDEAGRA